MDNTNELSLESLLSFEENEKVKKLSAENYNLMGLLDAALGLKSRLEENNEYCLAYLKYKDGK